MVTGAAPEPRSADDDEESSGPTPKELVAFVLGAPRRRRRMAVVTFLVCAALGVLVAVVKPPVYVAEDRILAQRSNTVEKVATNNAENNDSPTKGAAETIITRDNLIALLKETGVMDRWDSERTPILRLKDRLMRPIIGPVSDADRLRGMVGLLEKKLFVLTDENTITIRVEWGNAETAYRLVAAAQKNFIDARHDADVSMITDAIAILESYLAAERAEMDKALEELEGVEEQKGVTPPKDAGVDELAPAEAAPRAAPRSVALPPRAPPDPQLKKDVEEKKRQADALEEDRNKRLHAAQAELAELRSTLGPAHPQFVAVERRVEALSQPSPDVAPLRAAIAALQAQIESQAAEASEGRARAYLGSVGIDVSTAPRSTADAGGNIIVVAQPTDNAATLAAKTKLANATVKYDDLNSRLRAARIDLDAAQAAFKYKYSIITPPEAPRDPKKPGPTLIALLGVVAAFLMYYLLPALADLASGRIVASWQARKLGVALLGEVESPPP